MANIIECGLTKQNGEAGGSFPRLGALTSFPQDPGPIPSINTVPHNHL